MQVCIFVLALMAEYKRATLIKVGLHPEKVGNAPKSEDGALGRGEGVARDWKLRGCSGHARHLVFPCQPMVYKRYSPNLSRPRAWGGMTSATACPPATTLPSPQPWQCWSAWCR